MVAAVLLALVVLAVLVIGGGILIIGIFALITGGISSAAKGIKQTKQWNDTSKMISDIDSKKELHELVFSMGLRDGDICSEIDERIHDILSKRRRLEETLKENKAEYRRLKWRLWKSEEDRERKDELSEIIYKKQNRLKTIIFYSEDKETDVYKRLKEALEDLSHSNATTYKASKSLNGLINHYSPVGEMKLFSFEFEPTCLCHGQYIFCLVPNYIVVFSTKGKYICTLKPHVFQAYRTSGQWIEKVSHTTWTYTRKDGLPDRRYRHNPQRVYYTNVSHTDSNALGISFPGFSGTYDMRRVARNDYIEIINSYSTTKYVPDLRVMNSNRMHPIISLLKNCCPGDYSIIDIQDIIELNE